MIDGEEKEGGRWYREKHGYLSIPLYVREGGIIAMGAHDDGPVYGYDDGTMLLVYALADGAEASTCIYDTENVNAVTVSVKRRGKRYEAAVSGGKNMKVALMNTGEPKTADCAYEMDGRNVVLVVPESGKLAVEF